MDQEVSNSSPQRSLDCNPMRGVNFITQFLKASLPNSILSFVLLIPMGLSQPRSTKHFLLLLHVHGLRKKILLPLVSWRFSHHSFLHNLSRGNVPTTYNFNEEYSIDQQPTAPTSSNMRVGKGQARLFGYTKYVIL
mmetsp:Transcript_106/g.154  ORF Transcript_106/g.154 Transcript_106/m.154 type:complete len:136 (-) Transcript_106:932-1339(-)